MSWEDIRKERQPGWANEEEKWELREQMQRRGDKAASYDKPTYSDDPEYYLSIVPYGVDGESIEHLEHQHFIRASNLDLAKHRAERYSNRWLDDNAYNGVDYIEFKLYDEDDEEVHSGEIN